jgi:hypothetical protein
MRFWYAFACALSLVASCGPSQRGGNDDDPNAPCDPGTVEDCYDGQDGTEGVGPCHSGKRTCTDQALWTACEGQIVPAAENCSDGVDNNCNGAADEDVDADGDGVTTCGGDCCDSTECSDPALVNPGAFDAAGNSIDDDCNGTVDDSIALCDTGLASNSNDAVDYAKALEICQTATMADTRWGVISAKLSLADGSGTAAGKSHAIRAHFGTNVMPKGGVSVVLLSTGAAAGKGDTNPAWQDFQDTPEIDGNGTQSGFPADFVSANGGSLPNAPGAAPPPRATRPTTRSC